MPRLDDACIAQPFEHQHGYGYSDNQGKDDEEGGDATNPISIFVPCHRVIGSNQKLTGYGGGLDAKRELLALEARVSGSVLAL